MRINNERPTQTFTMKLGQINRKSIQKKLGEEALSIVDRAAYSKIKKIHGDDIEINISASKGLFFKFTRFLKITAIKKESINNQILQNKKCFKLWLKPIFSDEYELNYGNLIKHIENLYYKPE